MTDYDYIVVGLGCAGIGTMRELTKRGYDVLGIDQGSVPNPEATSYGNSRLIQYTSYTDPMYVSIIRDAVDDWKKLEQKYNTKLFFNTGTLEASHRRTQGLDKTLGLFKKTDLDYEIKTAEEATEKYRLFNFDDGFTVLETDSGGVLDAQKCLSIEMNEIRRNGGVINQHERVKNFELNSNSVKIETAESNYTADKIILTTGAWAVEQFDVLESLLEVRQHTYSHYLQVKSQIRSDHPGFLIRVHDDESYYGLVEHSNDAVKLGAGTNSIDPLLGSSPLSFTRGMGTESNYPEEDTARRFFDADNQGLNRSSCMITSTPDRNPIISEHPDNPRIVLGVGMSGHGFKYSNITGSIISDIATNSDSGYQKSKFCIGRFE